jgi:hypothetical protein
MEDPDPLGEAARKTYRYLRVAVVAMAVLLGVSVAIEIGFGPRGGILDSISAYYYTPVRGVFVGALMAVGLGLVAIKGREGSEDLMLNLAGMLAPLVALVPTPISVPVAGFEVERRTVPAELVPAVENNVAALLVLGVVGLTFATATAAKDGSSAAAHRRGLAVAGGLLVGLAVWFGTGRQSFLEYGHYAAAVPMFGLIVGVAVVNARHARGDAVMARLAAATYRRAYGAIAAAMGVTIVVAGVLFALDSAGHRPVASWLFWVEVVLLALFAAFWVFQTAENWDEGLPDGAPGRDEWRVGVDGVAD